MIPRTSIGLGAMWGEGWPTGFATRAPSLRAKCPRKALKAARGGRPIEPGMWLKLWIVGIMNADVQLRRNWCDKLRMQIVASWSRSAPSPCPQGPGPFSSAAVARSTTEQTETPTARWELGWSAVTWPGAEEGASFSGSAAGIEPMYRLRRFRVGHLPEHLRSRHHRPRSNSLSYSCRLDRIPTPSWMT